MSPTDPRLDLKDPENFAEHRSAADIWREAEIAALRARVARLESVLETTRALSDRRAEELNAANARLKVIEEFLRGQTI